MMQKDFTENWSKLCQSMGKPLMDLTELNIKTLNNITKNTSTPEEMAQVKKPEDMMAVQTKLFNNACVEATKYHQKAMEIGLGAMSEFGKMWTESLNKMTNKASDFAKANTGNSSQGSQQQGQSKGK